MHTIGVIWLKLLVNLICRDILVINGSSGPYKPCKLYQEIRLGSAKLYLSNLNIWNVWGLKAGYVLFYWITANTWQSAATKWWTYEFHFKMVLTQLLIITSEFCHVYKNLCIRHWGKKKYFVNLLLGVLITPLFSLGSENILSWMAGGNSEENMH